jgi:hypothetical protein
MTTKIKTVRYNNNTLAKYEMDKAVRIAEGWGILEENIQRREEFIDGIFKKVTVSGCIVYERK